VLQQVLLNQQGSVKKVTSVMKAPPRLILLNVQLAQGTVLQELWSMSSVQTESSSITIESVRFAMQVKNVSTVRLLGLPFRSAILSTTAVTLLTTHMGCTVLMAPTHQPLDFNRPQDALHVLLSTFVSQGDKLMCATQGTSVSLVLIHRLLTIEVEPSPVPRAFTVTLVFRPQLSAPLECTLSNQVRFRKSNVITVRRASIASMELLSL
jgi:hypothetical protein